MNKKEFLEYCEQTVAGTFLPELNWCKENCSVPEAKELWYYHPSPKYKALLKTARDNKVYSWDDFITPEESQAKKEKALSLKKQKYIEARIRGGIGKQSPALKQKLLSAITFEHCDGISLTVLPCNNVVEICLELNKTEASIVESTNLSKVIKGLKNTTKGWKITKCTMLNF